MSFFCNFDTPHYCCCVCKMHRLLLTIFLYLFSFNFSYVRRQIPPQYFNLFCSPFRGYVQPRTKEGAFFKAAELSNMPVIILVNPFLDQNVGSVARSMLNFGLTELRVVDPRCDIMSNNSKALAAGASDVLEYAKIFPTLKECISDLQVVMATTIRPRDMTQTIVSPSRAASIIASSDHRTRVGILFGTERSGLTNEEVAMADTIITIPTFGHFSSINLGWHSIHFLYTHSALSNILLFLQHKL